MKKHVYEYILVLGFYCLLVVLPIQLADNNYIYKNQAKWI